MQFHTHYRPLSTAEHLRYSRHLSLPEIGERGQQKLMAGRVLIIGAGGLGSPAALYLAAAGVGTIGIADPDRVDESNLQRQVLHGSAWIGSPKTGSASARLSDLNPFVRVRTYPERVTAHNISDLLSNYDLVVDGTDNFATRYLINDACALQGKPHVFGSITQFTGQVSVFHAGHGPCYRCLFPEPPAPGEVPSCSEAGVLGVLPGVIGTLQATEAIKLILGIGDSLRGRLLLYDALTMQFQMLHVERDPHCPLCGENPSIRELIDYEQFCGSPEVAEIPEITPMEFRERLASAPSGSLQILDVRENQEVATSHLPGIQHIPLGEIRARMGELDSSRTTIVVCKAGVRSARAITILRQNGYRGTLWNLSGGMVRWAAEMEPGMVVA